MKEKNWYILWTSSDRSEDEIKYIVSGLDVEIWQPSYDQKNVDGSTTQVEIYPGYIYVNCTLEDTEAIEELCKAETYTGVKFIRDHETNKPCKLSKDELKKIYNIECSYDVTEIRKNDKVKLTNSLFYGKKGEVIKAVSEYVYVCFSDDNLILWHRSCDCKKIKSK